MTVEKFPPVAPDNAGMLALLDEANLLASDLAEGNVEYIALGGEGGPAAFGGIAYCGASALLRSIVVSPDARGTGRGRTVVQHLLSRAAARGVRDVWLLTERAEGFFAANGFEQRPRDEAPPEIRATSQFDRLCPASAVLMYRTLP